MQQKVNMTRIGLSSTERRCLTDNDMLWRGPAGHKAGLGRVECEEIKAWAPACRLTWEGTLQSGANLALPKIALGRRWHWGHRLGMRWAEAPTQGASPRTEAHHTRRSSEAALGVFSRIRGEKLFFFLPVSGSSAHWRWSAKCTWRDKHMYAHMCTHTHTHTSFACAQPSYP